MNLQTWLKLHNISPHVFAQRLGKDKSLVHKYVYEGVIPKHDVLVKIFRLTLGVVTANDFHKLSHDELEREINVKVDAKANSMGMSASSFMS